MISYKVRRTKKRTESEVERTNKTHFKWQVQRTRIDEVLDVELLKNFRVRGGGGVEGIKIKGICGT